MEEREFMEKLLRGEREALELLFKKYNPFIFLLAYKILRDVDEAKDTVQEVFVRAFENIKSLKRRESLKSWLHSIAYRIAVDKERRMRLQNRIFFEMSENSKTALNGNKSEIRKFIEELNLKERSALLLHAEGFKAKEICEIIGCSESTVRVHLFNARKKLRKLLEGG